MSSTVTVHNITVHAWKDNYPLALTLFEPSSPPSLPPPTSPLPPAIQILSATGVPQRFYARFATHLAKTYSTPVATIDFRGIGDSIAKDGGLPALKEATTKDHWSKRDQPAITQFLRSRYPDRLIVSIGHSVGAHVAPFNPLVGEIERYFFVAANSPYMPNTRSPMQSRLFPLVVLASNAALGYFPAKRLGLCADLPAGVAWDWARWTRFPDYCAHEPDSALEYSQFNPSGGWLALAFSDDKFSVKKGFTEWARLLGPGTREEKLGRVDNHLIYLEPRDVGLDAVDHMGFFMEKSKGVAWDEAAKWIVHGQVPDFKAKGENLELKPKL
ncbi:hypothetical protein HK104_010008 [Borealophlyctis nickersoniae]|nr:hypothetical protein HK104_010008 [Borealophlyctis nickersoniae]